jgi:ABC-2 type transport system permease protein
MRSALHAEWTKLRTSPGTLALLFAVVAGTVGVSAAASACSGPICAADLPRRSLTGVQLGQAVVAILAVLVMGNEYSSGMIRVTLTAVPRRGRVLAAKAVLVAAVVAVTATVAVAGSLIVGRLLLPAHHLVLRPAVGSVLYLVLIGLLSLGAVTAVRNPAAAIGVVLALLYALPIVISVVTDQAWQKRLQQIGPASAGLAVQATTGDPVIGPWKGLGVLVLWAFGALLAGGVLLARRDA